jgi:hypothetical protein
MPTVMLVVTQGFAARYLLRTGILARLRERGADIVVLAPNADEPYLRAELAAAGATLEPLRAAETTAQRSRLWMLLYSLRTYSLGDPRSSPAFVTKYEGFRRQIRAERPFAAFCVHVAVQALWRSRLLRRALLALESRVIRLDAHADVFDRHRPAVVVTTGLGYSLPEALVLREAAARGIKTAAAISGWDNPSSKGYRGADVDRVFAWSDSMADQVARFHDYPRERVAVEGVAHFDRYVADGALWDRETLCERTGLDPDRRIVLFATSAPGLYAHNIDVVRGLVGALGAGRFGEAQLVARLHPIFFRGDQVAPLEELRALAAAHPHLHLDVPDIVSERLRCDLADEDNVRFSSLLASCDVLACVFSTTTLEAFIANRPVVFGTWTAHLERTDGAEPADQPDGSAQRPWHEFAHMREVVDSGAVPVADSMPALVDAIAAALADPEHGAEARRAIARRECGPTDGRSGERIADGMLALAGAEPVSPAPPRPLSARGTHR